MSSVLSSQDYADKQEIIPVEQPQRMQFHLYSYQFCIVFLLQGPTVDRHQWHLNLMLTFRISLLYSGPYGNNSLKNWIKLLWHTVKNSSQHSLIWFCKKKRVWELFLDREKTQSGSAFQLFSCFERNERNTYIYSFYLEFTSSCPSYFCLSSLKM